METQKLKGGPLSPLGTYTDNKLGHLQARLPDNLEQRPDSPATAGGRVQAALPSRLGHAGHCCVGGISCPSQFTHIPPGGGGTVDD